MNSENILAGWLMLQLCCEISFCWWYFVGYLCTSLGHYESVFTARQH